MPGYIIHLTEAKIITDFLEKEGTLLTQIGLNNFQNWKRQFEYGVLLPDVVDKMHKADSHFWKKSDTGKVVVTPDLKAFTDKYRVDRSKPLLYGYLAHLHLDKAFFGDYFKRYVCFLDSQGEVQENIKNISSVHIVKENKRIDLETFFSEEYLYGDYTKLNNYLINKYQIEIPVYPPGENIEKCQIREVKFDDLNILLSKLKELINNNKTDDFSTELKVLDKDTLENFLINAANEFLTNAKV